MSKVSQPYVSNRVLKLNVGFLLHAGSGVIRESVIDVPQPVRVADDVMVEYINGLIRLSRTKEGILLQGQLGVGVTGECFRCLERRCKRRLLHVLVR